MEDSVRERPVVKRRIWIRVIAVILVLGLMATAGLIEASSIVFSKTAGANAAEQDAAGYIGDTTEYLGAPLTQRMANVLYSYLREPVTYADFYLRMSLSISKGDYPAAREGCSKCIELWNDEDQPLSELWTKLACLDALLGDYGQARDELDAAIGLGGADEDPTMYLLRAQMSAQLGEAEPALSDIAAYEDLTGDFSSLLAIKGPLYEVTGAYALAEEAYTALLSSADEGAFDPAAYGSRARVRLLLGDFAGARADAEAFFAAGCADEGGATRYVLAACAMQQQDYALAEENFLLALEDGYPNSAEVYPSVVYVRYMQGDLTGAREAGETALSLEGGETAELLQWMGVIDMAQGAYDEAVQYFARSIALDDTQTNLHYYMGVCLVALGEYQVAADAFTISVGRGESLAESYYNRGVCYAALEQYESAYADMLSAIALSQDGELTASAADLRDKLAEALGG